MAVLSPLPHDYTRLNKESNILRQGQVHGQVKSTLMINGSQSCEKIALQGKPQSSSSSLSTSLLKLFGTKRVEKEVDFIADSVGHHCYFISQSTKML